jgi:hypothetical protein
MATKYEGVARLEATLGERELEIQKLKAKLVETPKRQQKVQPRTTGNGPVEQFTPAVARKLLLQFFLQGSDTRDSLIPTMLQMVGCDEKEIQCARRKWSEERQIISRSGLWGF